MSSYKTISDVVSDLNVMVLEAPLPEKERAQLADIAEQLLPIPETIKAHLVNKGDSVALHHDD